MQQVGPYRILEELGRGGVGVVYRAEDSRTGGAVAIKTLHDLGADPEALERFRREATLLHGIRHPNLVRVLDLDLTPPHPYAVFEYVPGETLQAKVEREGPLSWQLAVRVLSEVAAGVAAAHERELLHRDIKPDNILLAPQGAKLADFGMVKDLNRETLTATGALVGTPSYMAPEQAHGDKTRWGATTDVYGLAATLYFALTGRPPFQGTSPIATLTAVIEEPPRSPRALVPQVPEWLAGICLRGLAKLNGERFANAVALRAALLHGPPAPSAGRRVPLAALLGGAGAVLSVIALIVAWPKGEEPGPPPPPPASEQPIDVQPAAAEVDDPRIQEARDHYAAERYDLALRLFSDVLKDHPESVKALVGRGFVHRALKDPRPAGADAIAALQLDPQFAHAYLLLGRLESDLERFTAAIAAYDRALELDPEFTVASYRRGVCYLFLRRIDDALADFQRVVELDPNYGQGYLGRGSAYTRLGRSQEAIDDFDRALELGVSNASLYSNRGSCLAQLGRIQESIGDFDRALELNPMFVDALENRGRARYVVRQDELALRDLERAIELGTQNPIVWAYLGATRLKLRDLAGATEALDESLRRNPKNAWALERRGEAYLKLDRLDDALADFNRALELEPDQVQTLLLRFQILNDRGQLQAARSDLERAIELDPREGAGYFFRGMLKGRQGDLTGARADLRRSLDLGVKPGMEPVAQKMIRRIDEQLGPR